MKTVLPGVFTVQLSRLIKFASLLLLTVAAEIIAKPGAAISLRSPSVYQLEPRSVQQLNLEFALPGNAVSLSLRMQVEGSAQVLDPELSREFVLEKEQTRLQLPVQIETGEAGIHYLMFNLVLTYENGVNEARSLGIRLQVGDASAEVNLPKPTQEQTTEERIKELPAQEEIIY